MCIFWQQIKHELNILLTPDKDDMGSEDADTKEEYEAELILDAKAFLRIAGICASRAVESLVYSCRGAVKRADSRTDEGEYEAAFDILQDKIYKYDLTAVRDQAFRFCIRSAIITLVEIIRVKDSSAYMRVIYKVKDEVYDDEDDDYDDEDDEYYGDDDEEEDDYDGDEEEDDYDGDDDGDEEEDDDDDEEPEWKGTKKWKISIE